MTNNPNFITKLDMTPLPDGVNWKLNAALKYKDSKHGIIVVPAGFQSDMASIPPLARFGGCALALAFVGHFIWSRWFWLVVAAPAWIVIMLADSLEHEGTYDQAACLHDWMYKNRLFPRWKCDWILFVAMWPNTRLWKRILIWLNVRLFGWIFY